jgi:CRP-like cAMP-binding protein
MATLLDLVGDLPEISIRAGEPVCLEGEPAGPIWVLVSGRLAVLRGNVQVNVVDRPGAMIGEISVLLNTPTTASVVATTPAVLKRAPDGAALLATSPEITTFVATELARRLQNMTTYLADLTNQYGDAPGLAMVGDVLGRLTGQRPTAQPGSRRDPDPEY